MMAALESYFYCTGFNTSPVNNVYYFTDVTKVTPIKGNTCNAHYDKLLRADTGSVGQQFIGISTSGVFLMIWLCIVGVNFQHQRKQVAGTSSAVESG